jgi:hypothetical protein
MIGKLPRLGKIRGTIHRSRKHFWQRWHNPARQTTPAFLVGCGRSGTGMLVHHLSQSWQMALYNETNPAAFEKYRLRDLSVIESLVDRSYAQVTLFKPILDTCQTAVLLARFPAAKIIFAFRHYDDVINSSAKAFGTNSRFHHVQAWIDDDFSEFAVPPPETTKNFVRSRWRLSLSPASGAALYWLFYNRLYFDLNLDQDERVRLVCYESVVKNPAEQFEGLCQFMGLQFTPQIIEGVFSSSIGHSSPPEIDPQIRDDCEELRQQLLQHA